MSATRLALAVSAALVLAACSIGRPAPQVATFVVEPPMPAPATERRPQTLRMGNVRVAASFAGPSLVYRTSDVKYVSDPYASFIADPAAQLGSRMAEWLDRAGPFKSVAQPGSARPASFVLEATVTELYGDFRPGQAPAAVLSLQFALIDPAGLRPVIVLDSTIARRTVIAEPTPDALVRGFGAAMAEILRQLASELQQVGPR
jgi:cholesterol transport system auxiliary component